MRSRLPDDAWLLATPDTMPEAPNRGSNSTRIPGLGNQIMSLLPTPLANLGSNGGPQSPEKRRAGGHSVSIEDAVHGLLPTPTTRDSEGSGGSKPENVTITDAVVRTQLGTRENPRHVELLPTPTVGNATGGNASRSGDRSGEKLLPGIATDLLPTPRASRGASATETVYALGGERQDDDRTQGQVVLDEVADWGKYRDAVERTEAVTGIPAPAPAIPDGKGGKMRLHDRFVEWMMLLAPGWVTGHGLTRQKALERLGNGVVPLQAAAATATNLHRLVAYKRALEAAEVAA